MRIRIIAALVVMSQLLSALPAAAVPRENYSYLRDQGAINQPAEFVFRNDPDETLIPVYLLGAVGRPGLYHVPLRTDLVTLLALSGGPTEKADVSHVTIKRPSTHDVAEVDLDKVMTLKDLRSPTLNNNDVVMVGARDQTSTQNTLMVVGIVSGIVGIIVSSVLLTRTSK
jgi:hypothetical protein